jgi:glycosyltransferase involved in cell wall biosynthesis
MLVCNAANSPLLWISKFFGPPTAVNVDGIERMRAKWNWLGRLWYRLGERCSVLFAKQVISDADVIYQYYKKAYCSESVVIPYGCDRSEDERVQSKLAGEPLHWAPEEEKLFDELGVTPGNYVLYVSRLEPENNAHVVIQAHRKLAQEDRRIPLVVVGDAPYADEYKQQLRELGDEQVKFAGFRFGSDYKTLQLGARVYVQATEVGGTHPALVEAMGFGNCIVANETPENCEVLGGKGLIYTKNSSDSLAQHLSRLIGDDVLIRDYAGQAVERARQTYDWSLVADRYEQLFYELCSKSMPTQQ